MYFTYRTIDWFHPVYPQLAHGFQHPIVRFFRPPDNVHDGFKAKGRPGRSKRVRDRASAPISGLSPGVRAGRPEAGRRADAVRRNPTPREWIHRNEWLPAGLCNRAYRSAHLAVAIRVVEDYLSVVLVFGKGGTQPLLADTTACRGCGRCAVCNRADVNDSNL